MRKNEMYMSFLADSVNESLARITVAAFAMELNPTMEEIEDIRTSVSEAVTNAIIHGYEEKEGMVKKDGLYVPKELADKKEEALKKDGDK